MKNICILLVFHFIVFMTPMLLQGQQQSAIDSIFSQWQNKKAPGVVVGLIYGDDKDYTLAFGYADVQNEKKNTVQTPFQIGYLSRQFVVFGILVLESQEKLSMDDSIQKFLTDFPKYDHEIKVSHLVNHSSGLNNHSVLRRLIGIENNGIHTQEDALHLIKSQEKLNFVPGTAFSHMTSKTEITLMLEIIKNASGQSLESFFKEHMFRPLQMNHSSFSESYNDILPNKAISYQTQDDTLMFQKVGFNNVFYSTAEDMMKWYRALTGKSTSILSPLIQKLDEAVTLENGDKFDSWWGQLTLGRSFYHKERGLPAYWQFGRIGGYASNVFRFPDQQLTSFVLGNNNVYNGMPAMLHANHYIENQYTEPSSIDVGLLKTKKLSAKDLKKYEGHFWDAERGIARRLVMERDTLFYKRLNQEEGTALIPLAHPETFQFLNEGDEKIILSFKKSEGNLTYDIALDESEANTYLRYTPIEATAKILEEYQGSFYCTSLRIIYDFNIYDGQLSAKGPKGRTVVFYPVMKDTFRSDALEFGSIRFDRDTQSNIQGFRIFTDGITNLEFIKLKKPS
ncbi:serine hydrolase domain-containing protein [Flagellimonas sp.]|uniref:serine hydrolase domain-containing protein n=1 Tax=Flagellimonas sp. TaxID=2058762 RepID=UPI003F4A81FD